MLGSVLGYFLSILTVFATVMTFMTLLIGVFDNSTFEKLRHYPRPIIERTVTPAPPNNEPYHISNPEPHRTLFALGTSEAAAPKDLSAHDNNTNNSRVASIAKADAEKRRSERKIRPEELAHLRQPRQPKVLTRQRQNYDGHGYATALGYAEGRSALEDSNGQR